MVVVANWRLDNSSHAAMIQETTAWTPNELCARGGSALATLDYMRKAREHELATFDENRRAVGMLTPMRDKN